MSENSSGSANLANPDRAAVIEQHLPLVRYIAKKLARSGVCGGVADLDDLVSWGTVGLIQAVNRFDGTRGAPFAAFAAVRVRGAIIDGLRQLDGVPRAVRRDARDLDRIAKSFYQALGYEPTDEEACRSLGWTRHRYTSVITIARRRQVSLDELSRVSADDGVRRNDSLVDPDGDDLSKDIERTQVVEAVRQAMDRLPAREREVLRLLYLEGLNAVAVAEAMGLSSSRISQLKERSFSRLRADPCLREVA